MFVKGNLWKKFLFVWLCLMLILPSAANGLALAAPAENGQVTLSNDFLAVSVNKQNGRFGIRTKEGSPLKAGDDNKQLLFQDELPDTSFTTFRINGKDFIYGNGYGFLGSNGYFTYSPANQGYTNQSVWNAEGLEISQTLTLVEDQTNPNAGNVKVSYKVKNTTNRSVELGTRILLDTMLGPVDASPISVAGGNDYIRNETEIDGTVPYYWKATDNPLSPKVMSYGFLQGWGNKAPNRMIIAHWNGISETKWDYSVDKTLDFTSTHNKYGSADSVVAMYWDPSGLAPGGEAEFETYYGLGSFFTSSKQATYQLQVSAPKQLTLNDARNGYKEEEFEIQVEIDNSIDRSAALEDVNAVLGLPAELELAEGERRTKPVGSMKVGETKTVVWKVKPKPQYAYKAAPFQVIVQAAGGEENIQASFVVLPALSGKIPELQLLEATPHKLYMLDENPSMTLQGKGFEVLKGSSDWQVHMVRDRDGAEVQVPKADVTILDDKRMTVRLQDSLWPSLKEEPGKYRVRIDAGVFGVLEQTIELTNDPRFKPRDYGILLVVGDKLSPDRDSDDETYSIVPVENEEKLKQLKEQYASTSLPGDKAVLLEFRGAIRKPAGEDTVYEIGAGTTINSVIRYDTSDKLSAIFGKASQQMTIRKHARDSTHNGDYIELTGNGVLSIPGFPFAFGPFSVEMTDGSRYSLEANEDDGTKPIEIGWEVLKGLSLVQQMGFFEVEMKNAVIGDESVSFGGSVSMNFSPGDKKDEQGGDQSGGQTPTGGQSGSQTPTGNQNGGQTPPPSDPADHSGGEEEANRSGDDFELGLALDEAKFGIRKQTDLFGRAGTFGFLGLRAEGTAGLPKNMVPGMDLGASGRVLLDTFDRKFEIEANVKFKVVEVNGLLTLRFTESGVPIPDNFIFVVGGEPGIPLIPTTPIAYITKGGGGFQNMYDTLMGNFNFLPPLKLVMVGGLSIAKVVTADNVTVGLSMRGVEFSGDFEIAKFPILKQVSGSIMVEDSLKKFGVAMRAGAKLEILDIITGDVYLVFEYDSTRNGLLGPVYMAGGGSVAIKIPDAVPLFGGKEIGSASGEISTEKIWGKAKIIGIPFGFKYVWGDSMPTIASLGPVKGEVSDGLMNQNVFDDKGNISGTFTYGTNIKKVDSSSSRLIAPKSRDRVSILESGQHYNIAIPNQEIGLMEFRYTGDTPPKLQMKDPNGGEYPLIPDENYLEQTISAKDSQSGKEEKRVYVSIQKPLAGDWSVTSDRELDWTLMNVAVPPSLTDVSVTQTATHQLKVDWKGDHTSNEKVSLFLSTDNVNDPGRLLVENLDVAAGTANITLPETVASGNYYIKATISKDDTNLDSKYSGSSFAVANPYQPASPANVTAVPAGNGLFDVAWSMEQAPDGYTIQLLDENGKPVPGTGTVDVAGSVLKAKIGGEAEDTSGNKIGLVPGSVYKLSIGAYKEVDGVRVYGEPAVTAGVYLPVPKPAQVQLTPLTSAGEPIANSYGENGQQTYVTKENAFQLHMQSDQPVSTTVKVNNVPFGTFLGGDWKQSIPLQEGTNLIEVFSKNADGDTTLSGIRMFSDTTAPDLKIESPQPGSVSPDGQAVVKGTAEPGSKVTINGEPVTLGAEGSFEQTVSLDGYLSKPLVVAAKDDAGNETVYSSELINGALDSFEKVNIRPVGASPGKLNDKGELELPAGGTQPLELAGIDAEGREYAIDPSRVEWSVLLGDAYGSVSEQGEITAADEGELVVKATYWITKDYALENTIVVKVTKPAGEPETPPPNYDDWYIPPSTVGDSENTAVPPQQKVDEAVDQTLQNILKRIIEQEQDVQYIASASLQPNKETVTAIDDRAAIRIPAQPLQEAAGIGIGVVRDPGKYESDGLKVVGDIYEFKFDKPVRLEKPAELTIRYNLDELKDLSKAADYWYNDQTKKWEYVGGKINPAAGTIEADLPHFSKYALLYNENFRQFEDMRGRWSGPVVYRLASIGAIDGVDRGGSAVFEPERQITRQEFLKIALGAAGIGPSGGTIPANSQIMQPSLPGHSHM